MSDAELIARLRDWMEHDEGKNNDAREAAADRIEALTKERDSLLAGHRALNIGGARLQDRAETAEAKLAKAVEALRFYAWENEMRLPSDGPWGAGSTDFGKVARATLAEIKGGNDAKSDL